MSWLILLTTTGAAGPNFALHPGDTVAFYGDSMAAQGCLGNLRDGLTQLSSRSAHSR